MKSDAAGGQKGIALTGPNRPQSSLAFNVKLLQKPAVLSLNGSDRDGPTAAGCGKASGSFGPERCHDKQPHALRRAVCTKKEGQLWTDPLELAGGAEGTRTLGLRRDRPAL